MSIPKGKTSYFGRYEDNEKFRLINQAGVRVRRDPAGLGYSSCWDLNYSPVNGKIYFAPCHENGTGAQTRLVSYDFDKDEAKIEIKIEDLTLPKERVLPHTKLHESISFKPDGTLVATTHSTDRPPHHPSWMPFAHVDHVWEGFPGSYLLQFDPETGDARNLGQPAPRESIYGGCYVAARNAFYMIGFMRGHVYRYSFDDKTVKDLGKAAELYCYRLHEGPDHNVYGMTKSGFLFRVNTENDELEDMNFRLPATPDNFVNNTWYRYMSQAINVSDHEFVFTATAAEHMWLCDTDTLEVKCLGKRAPVDYPNEFEGCNFCLDEFGVDKDGVLWYGLNGWHIDKPVDEFYRTIDGYILVRWDYKNGKKPEALGIIGTQKDRITTIMCLCLDPVRDRLYGIVNLRDVNGTDNGELGILAIDLAQYREHMYEAGPIWEQDMTPKPYEEKEIAEIKAKANEPIEWKGEEVSGDNPYAVVPLANVVPVRLWRSVPYTEIPESKVQGLAWDENGSIHGVCGDQKKYYFRIDPRSTAEFASKAEADACEEVMIWRSIQKKRMREYEKDGKYVVEVPYSFSYAVTELKPYDELCDCRKSWLEASLLPGKLEELAEGTKLPEVAGRRYLATATATAKLADGRIAVGTKDGMFALIRNGKVFSMGNAAPMGPVRCMAVAPDGTLYGTCGDEEDMGTVFRYDDENGLVQMGLINYNSPGYMDGPTAANVLSSIAVSPDGKYLAVGGADRIGSVHILKL